MLEYRVDKSSCNKLGCLPSLLPGFVSVYIVPGEQAGGGSVCILGVQVRGRSKLPAPYGGSAHQHR